MRVAQNDKDDRAGLRGYVQFDKYTPHTRNQVRACYINKKRNGLRLTISEVKLVQVLHMLSLPVPGASSDIGATTTTSPTGKHSPLSTVTANASPAKPVSPQNSHETSSGCNFRSWRGRRLLGWREIALTRFGGVLGGGGAGRGVRRR